MQNLYRISHYNKMIAESDKKILNTLLFIRKHGPCNISKDILLHDLEVKAIYMKLKKRNENESQ